MKPILKHSIALALLLLLQTSLLAQQYPVQANLNVVTPCPNKLSSFFPLSGSRLNLSLLLTDITQAEVQVRLYVKIEGAGLTIQSQPNPSLPVFTLQGGVPLTLGQQIEPYFRTANLLATGNGALQFLQNGVLPEGFFTITITVIEHRRNVQISNPANTYAWIIVNDPPQLVTPSNNQTLEPGGIQNIFISWIPRHVVNPTSGSHISYNLSLWEVPQGFDPQMVVNTLQPLETVSSYSPNVIWGPDKTALTPGKRYVVAVKAIDPNNEVTFKNNGFSAAHSFVYGQPCLTPINLSHSNVFIQTADVAWYALGAAQNFRVEFKAASEANDAWRNLDVNQTNTTISNLAPNTQYSYRVSAVCGSFVSNPTANKSFTTLSIPPLDKECTSDISVPQTDESPLLTSLPAGQLFFAAGFPVEVGPTTQIAPNTFNGKGIITLPLFNFGIRANLKGIKVNHSLQMVAGTVEAVYGDSLVLIGAPGTTQSGPGSVDFSNPNDTIILNTPIDSVYMNDDG
ncbi:MAG: fibronectin type III domain-containing protein, partial [Tenuifilaceae bacterium]|nr:fibronectin type III domain-containing protein [Tenuifilaceae bacterium]